MCEAFMTPRVKHLQTVWQDVNATRNKQKNTLVG